MTRSLRTTHLRIWVLIALVLPFVFWQAAGVQQSKIDSSGPRTKLPPQARVEPDENADQLLFDDSLWRGARMMTRFFQNPQLPERFWVQLAPRDVPDMPESLVYFSPTMPTDGLPAAAEFLGAFHPERSHTLAAPPKLGVDGGYLLVYSPDLGRVWASAQVAGGFASPAVAAP